jgi:hypothetical protein
VDLHVVVHKEVGLVGAEEDIGNEVVKSIDQSEKG